MAETDILIIGAGPTGLTLALELAAQTPSPSFRIIEATLERSNKSRALVLHPRTLELLARHGIVQSFLSRGTFNSSIRIFANQKFVFEIDLKSTPFRDTAFPNPLMISQAETEAVLEEALGKYGVVVERGVRAERVVQDEGGVTALLKISDENDGEKEEEVRFKYIVGCDGAHSIVRKSAGMKYEGGVYPQDFILADAHLKWEQKSCLSIFLGDGFMGVFPMKDGIYRFIVSRPKESGSDVEPTLKDFEDVMGKLVPGKVEIFDPVWLTRFRLHHRMVDDYRKGRMFVAGDAAHIHSPAGGQGMNTGMQDAVNLGWKLASVIGCRKDDSFLDTYNMERQKVGLKLLHGTDRMFEMMATSNPVWLYLRNTLVPWIIPWVMRDPATRENRFRFVSQLGIRYRNSPIVGQASSWKGALRGGDRAPDGEMNGAGGESMVHGLCRGTSHHLLFFSGVGDAAASEERLEAAGSDFLKESDESLVVHKILNTPAANGRGNIDQEGKIHKLFGFKEPGYVLVRPDGYISFIGLLSTMDELKIWVKKYSCAPQEADHD
jgi:2-polyprenyl-6-methoxyphenol hydroxylase-like FAD-dependent oxidoreductase